MWDHLGTVFQVVTAIAAAIAAVFTYLSHSAMQTVKLEINGRMTELMTAVKSVAKSEGVQEEREAQKHREDHSA
jgi:hypothetical protein